MNTITKITAVMSGVMLFGASYALPVHADESLNETSAIVIMVNDETHTYEAYRIFKGRVATDGTIADLEWAEGIDPAGFLSALKASAKLGDTNPFTECESASDVARVLKEQANDSDFMKEVGKLAADHKAEKRTDSDPAGNIIRVTGAGYYLVLDVTEDTAPDEAKSESLLWTTQAENEINAKREAVSITKTVTDRNGNAAKTADYTKGDTVPYTVTFSLPDNYAVYDSYRIVIRDTLADGLSYADGSFRVSADGQALTEVPVIDGQGFTLTIEDLKQSAPDAAESVTVTYEALVKDTVNLGSTGNPNTAEAEYSNDPNGTGTGTATPSGANVYSFELKVEKKDADTGEALNGATFTLSGPGGYTETIEGTELSVFEFKGLEAGTYTLTEDVAPMGFNSVAPVTVVIEAGYSGEDGLTMLSVRQGEGDAVEGDLSSGIVEIEVSDEAGTVLPSAGGMGVYAIYGAGAAALAAGGAALLKSRKKEDEE